MKIVIPSECAPELRIQVEGHWGWCGMTKKGVPHSTRSVEWEQKESAIINRKSSIVNRQLKIISLGIKKMGVPHSTRSVEWEQKESAIINQQSSIENHQFGDKDEGGTPFNAKR